MPIVNTWGFSSCMREVYFALKMCFFSVFLTPNDVFMTAETDYSSSYVRWCPKHGVGVTDETPSHTLGILGPALNMVLV